MNENITIFIDMDDVLVNYAHNVAKHFGFGMEEFYERWPKGVYELYHAVGKPDKEVWDIVRKLPPEFWETMPEFSWSRQLWDHCNSIAYTEVLTAPVNCEGCLCGKWRWLQNFTKEESFDRYHIAKRKDKCGQWNHILIDDKEKNIDAFAKKGGQTILFPSHGNRLHPLRKDPMAYALPEIAKAVKMIEAQAEERAILSLRYL